MNEQKTSNRGIASLKAYFKDDITSGFSVSLIALPLCLGIAIASGVPPLAGIITAIVGGIFGSRISGSYVTISGPAAGLIVIILGAVEGLGGAGTVANFAGYTHALGAIVIAGAIMALFGLFKVGKLGDFFPSAAVHGMLSAIGVIIMIKQWFPAIGVTPIKGSILAVAASIPGALAQTHIPTAIISITALAILIGHPHIPSKAFRKIPAPMLVLVVSIGLARLLKDDQIALVTLPGNLFGEGGITFPSFEKIATGAFWSAVAGISLVAAIESLLSAKAVDELDPMQRKSNLDQDLVAMGSSSSIAAFLGGLPMISEIVRSSANVNNGGKSQWANFWHGVFLLIFLLLAKPVIEMIPLSALAAMLVFTGFRLASPKEFKHMLAIGTTEFIVFITTLVAVLATDLLLGIAIGIALKYVLLLFQGVGPVALFKLRATTTETSTQASIQLEGALHFSNYLKCKSLLDEAFKNASTLDLDFSKATLVDHTVMSHLTAYQRRAEIEGKTLNFVHLEQLQPVSNYPTAERHG